MCHNIFSRDGALLLVDARALPADACHCRLNGYKRLPDEDYCIRSPDFTAINITFLAVLVLVQAVVTMVLLRLVYSCTSRT